jgi:formylmethanofuran dehydrogenase subunit E
VAMAETDICALDAIAVLTGCTPGNRNLVVRDYGKNAYTFWRLADGKAVRISGRPAWDASYQALRAKVSSGSSSEAEKAQLAEATVAEAERILALDPRELFDVTPVSAPVPCTSQVDPWVTCERCREPVMEGRTRRRQGLQLCIPCFEVAAAAA